MSLDLGRTGIPQVGGLPTPSLPHVMRFPMNFNPMMSMYNPYQYPAAQFFRPHLNPATQQATSPALKAFNQTPTYISSNASLNDTGSSRSDNSSDSPPHSHIHDQSEIGSRNGEKTCRICGDRATGLHYGIISCEGCKGFFKRSICNRRVYRCTRDKMCMMSRKQRNRCQYCRLKRCLEAGMNRKAIREDGMPGGRNKSIGPIQMSAEEISAVMDGTVFNENHKESTPILNQSPPIQQLPAPPALRIPENPPPTVFQPQFMNFTSTPQMPKIVPKIDPVGEILELDHFQQIEILKTVSSRESLNTSELLLFLAKSADELLKKQIDWAKSLPFAGEITLQDHISLLMNTWAETMVLYTFTIHHDDIFQTLGQVVQKSESLSAAEIQDEDLDIVEDILRVYAQFAGLRITKNELSIVKLINFLNHDITGLKDPNQVEALNKKYWFLFQHWLNERNLPTRFRELVRAIPNTRVLASKLKQIEDLERLSTIFTQSIIRIRNSGLEEAPVEITQEHI